MTGSDPVKSIEGGSRYLKMLMDNLPQAYQTTR